MSATMVVVAAMYVVILVDWLVFSAKPFNVFVWSGVIGTLILLVAYALATVGVTKLLFFSGPRRVPTWEIVVPILALVLIAYTLDRNVIPYPEEGASRFIPVVWLLWLLAAVVIVAVRPAAAQRAGARLTQEEGLAPAEEVR